MTDRASRKGLKRDLKREVERLSHHIDHLSLTDLDIIDGIVGDLEQIHTNDVACKAACTKIGRDKIPWGTSYAPWWERWWRAAFSNEQR